MKKIFELLLNTLYFVRFLTRLVRQRSFVNKIGKIHKKNISVLANGPSLKESLNEMQNTKQNDCDFIAMNYYGNTDYFWKIKPNYYCFADPIFWDDSPRKNESLELFENFEKADWPIIIFVPSEFKRKFISFSNLKNKFIQIVGVNTAVYEGFEALRYIYYKKGLAMPECQTVAILTIYVAIMLGYDNVFIYGLDHSYTTSLFVDADNIVCRRYEHFYSSKEDNLQPMGMDMVTFFTQGLSIFKSHKQLAHFASLMNVNVLNLTKDSFVDAYKRK